MMSLLRMQADDLRRRWTRGGAEEGIAVDEDRPRMGLGAEEGSQVHGLADHAELFLACGPEEADGRAAEAEPEPEADLRALPLRRLPVPPPARVERVERGVQLGRRLV